MSRISAQYVDGLEFRIKELGEQVEKLTKERDTEIARNRPLQSLIKLTEETKSFLLKKSEENKEAVKQLDSERQANAVLTEELAALAEQNEKMRKALTKWRYLDSSYHGRCGPCGNKVEYGHKKGCALSLTNLATPVLNRIKAEAYREAADIVENIDVYTFVHGGSRYYDGGLTLSSAATAIRAKADELEQSK